MARTILTEDEYVYMSLADVMKAKGICHHITDRYWSVHPERGLMFFPWLKSKPSVKYSSPQCNSNKQIAERICPPFAEVRFIESVLQPIDPQSYDD